MAQFDVYPRRNAPGFIMDCQAHALERLNTRFVVPLLPRSMVPMPMSRFNPLFLVEGVDVVLMPQNAATVSVRELGRAIISLETERYIVMNAIDMLLSGY